MEARLEAIGQQLPFPFLGIDSDNDSLFINETLVQYCAEFRFEFTPSEACRSNYRRGLSRGTVPSHDVSSAMTVTPARWPERP